VFIDGPHHGHDEEKRLDGRKTACLEDAGYAVVRFGPEPGGWTQVLAKHPEIFGRPT
jgi:very-short-patch-repair endonuclease